MLISHIYIVLLPNFYFWALETDWNEEGSSAQGREPQKWRLSEYGISYIVGCIFWCSFHITIFLLPYFHFLALKSGPNGEGPWAPSWVPDPKSENCPNKAMSYTVGCVFWWLFQIIDLFCSISIVWELGMAQAGGEGTSWAGTQKWRLSEYGLALDAYFDVCNRFWGPLRGAQV